MHARLLHESLPQHFLTFPRVSGHIQSCQPARILISFTNSGYIVERVDFSMVNIQNEENKPEGNKFITKKEKFLTKILLICKMG